MLTIALASNTHKLYQQEPNSIAQEIFDELDATTDSEVELPSPPPPPPPPFSPPSPSLFLIHPHPPAAVLRKPCFFSCSGMLSFALPLRLLCLVCSFFHVLNVPQLTVRTHIKRTYKQVTPKEYCIVARKHTARLTDEQCKEIIKLMDEGLCFLYTLHLTCKRTCARVNTHTFYVCALVCVCVCVLVCVFVCVCVQSV